MSDVWLVLLLVLLPTQLGKHFWLNESLVLGRRIDYLSPTIYFTDILVIGFCMSLIWEKQHRLNFPKRKSWLILVVILSLGLTSMFQSPVKLISLFYFARIIELWVLAWGVIYKKPQLKLWLLPLAASCIYSSLLAVAQFLNQASLNQVGFGWSYFLGERSFTNSTPGIAQAVVNGKLLLRPYATFPHPNVLAGYLVILWPMLVYFLPKFFGWQKRLLQTASWLSLIAIGISFSRSAWLVFILVALGLVSRRLFKKQNKLIPIVILTLTGFVIAAIFITNMGLLTDTESWEERWVLLTAAWKMFLERPLFGWGWLSFISLLPKFNSGTFILQPVHSIYFLILAESGIVGLILFLYLLGFALYKSYKKHNFAILMSLCSAMILGLFDHYLVTLTQTQILLTVLIALALFKTK